ncbi:MAG: hemolysin III family protein [Turicibacter sp.]|nr:hemolysin III family protein [Turicibacter sp.]
MKRYVKEEIANAVTHGVGFLLSIAGLVLLILRTVGRGPLAMASVVIFGSSMILLYLCSTMLHSFFFLKAKRVFTILDHSAIYILIAGTYTPFLLLTLEGGPLGWTLFGIVWAIAIAGVVFKSIFADRFNVVSTIGYLAMGWLILFAIGPLFHNLATWGFVLLMGGGVLYSTGTIFYLWEKLPFSHAIWHLFVMAGSACMFFSVLFFA